MHISYASDKCFIEKGKSNIKCITKGFIRQEGMNGQEGILKVFRCNKGEEVRKGLRLNLCQKCRSDNHNLRCLLMGDPYFSCIFPGPNQLLTTGPGNAWVTKHRLRSLLLLLHFDLECGI